MAEPVQPDFDPAAQGESYPDFSELDKAAKKKKKAQEEPELPYTPPTMLQAPQVTWADPARPPVQMASSSTGINPIVLALMQRQMGRR